MLREAKQEQRTCQATRDQLKLHQLNGQTTTEGRMLRKLREGLRLALSSSPSNLQSRQIVMSHFRFSSQQKTSQTCQPAPPFPRFDWIRKIQKL
jgi:hypothetical protein